MPSCPPFPGQEAPHLWHCLLFLFFLNVFLSVSSWLHLAKTFLLQNDKCAQSFSSLVCKTTSSMFMDLLLCRYSLNVGKRSLNAFCLVIISFIFSYQSLTISQLFDYLPQSWFSFPSAPPRPTWGSEARITQHRFIQGISAWARGHHLPKAKDPFSPWTSWVRLW